MPNTDEYTGTFSVKISAKDDTEKIISLDTFDHQIKIISPMDMNFNIEEWRSDQSIAGNRSNIYTNKGTGFRFAAYGKENGESRYFWLADVSLKSKAEILEEYAVKGPRNEDCDFYNVSYNPEYLDSTGNGMNGFRLSTHGGDLYFENAALGISIQDFAIKGIGNVRPGDDFLLRFALTSDANSRGTVEDKDFLAIYEKKMLWRANLYIDERKYRDGSWRLEDETRRNLSWDQLTAAEKSQLSLLDWNDLNPWIGENSWSNATSRVEGGQIDIAKWSHYMHSGVSWDRGRKVSEDNEPYIFMSVAYSHDGIDSVPNFNDDMEDQRQAMRNSTLALYNNHDSTLAPDNNWLNYLSSSHRPQYANIIRYPSADQNEVQAFINAGVNSSEYFGNSATKTAGADCGGLLTRSAAYDNSGYFTLGNLNDLMRDSFNVDPYFPQENRVTNARGNYPATINDETRIQTDHIWSINNDNLIVPGDIVSIQNHVMIFFQVQYDEEGRVEFDRENTRFIEETMWHGYYQAQNHHSINFYDGYNKYVGHVFGRLRNDNE